MGLVGVPSQNQQHVGGTIPDEPRCVSTTQTDRQRGNIMKKTLIAAALLSAFSSHAFAQTTSDTTTSKTPAAVTSDTKNANAPVEGANSFTEAQAKDRIAEAGYTGVSALKLDDKGVWRGTAMKNGTSTPVGLDYQGNVVAQ
jgi:microcystin-dependent protein